MSVTTCLQHPIIAATREAAMLRISESRKKRRQFWKGALFLNYKYSYHAVQSERPACGVRMCIELRMCPCVYVYLFVCVCGSCLRVVCVHCVCCGEVVSAHLCALCRSMCACLYCARVCVYCV